ncbi:MAG: hypothetical protein L3J32_01115 [Rhizobiaceae bacterium]|nr:hypothetical protein [Rhizobiaceae bacterium]
MKKINALTAGFIAAAAFAAMMVVFSGMGFLVLIPVFLGSLPIYIAALGWGTRAGIVATLTIMGFGAIATDPLSGLLIGMTMAAPAALAGHQANLAQSSNNGSGELEWYPLSRILLWISMLIAGAILVFGLMVDFDPLKFGPEIAKQMKPHLPSVEGRPDITEEQLSTTFTMNLRLLPFVLPSFWVGIHVLNLLAGLRITRRMGVLARPEEDIAANISLPQISLIIVLVALAGMSVTSPPLSYVFAVVAGALVMAFSVVGLSIFHQHTRDWAGRGPLLFVTYMMIGLMFFPVYLFAIAGIVRTSRLKGADPK